MRIREVSLEMEKGLIIYITEEEKNNPDIKDRISDLTSKYKTVSIFISGTEDIRKVLKQMIANRCKGQ